MDKGSRISNKISESLTSGLNTKDDQNNPEIPFEQDVLFFQTKPPSVTDDWRFDNEVVLI